MRRRAPGRDFDLTVEQVRFETVQGRYVAVAAKISWSSSVTKYSWVTDYSRSEIDFDPDFAKMGAFVMVAPPDYSVVNYDLPNVQWKLQNGKFIPAVDEAVVKSVDRLLAQARNTPPAALTSSAKSPQSRWPWLLVAAGGFVLGGAVVFVLLRRRTGAKTGP